MTIIITICWNLKNWGEAEGNGAPEAWKNIKLIAIAESKEVLLFRWHI